MLKEEGTTQEALQKFLFNYRRTPCSTLSEQSPAEVFLGRRLRSALTLLKHSEPTIGLRRNQKMEAQFNKHHAARSKMFEPHVFKWARDYCAGYPRGPRDGYDFVMGDVSTTLRLMVNFGDDKRINCAPGHTRKIA
ncbi:hypothetical protein TELCIR_06262 [Teladorsagia circumcincta]|uniref:Uncharacterized protein n=1 Tax=Teladorsagia circumcincta TaxID=45464 RepID=A0A2G9UQ21_TELCI|nr:hypothetical protein TELCIR_06262 [Teladorsagia circumcincta]